MKLPADKPVNPFLHSALKEPRSDAPAMPKLPTVKEAVLETPPKPQKEFDAAKSEAKVGARETIEWPADLSVGYPDITRNKQDGTAPLRLNMKYTKDAYDEISRLMAEEKPNKKAAQDAFQKWQDGFGYVIPHNEKTMYGFKHWSRTNTSPALCRRATLLALRDRAGISHPTPLG